MGLTESQREIIPLMTPERLNVSNIWDIWLPNYIPNSTYENLSNNRVAKFRLELLFATTAPIPRGVQYIISNMKKFFLTDQGGNMFEVIDSKALEGFYLQSYDMLERKYYSMRNTIILPKHMRAILFEEVIKLDEDLTKMITNSFLVNSLQSISKDVLLVPKTSILSLKIYSKYNQELYWQSIRLAIEKLDELFTDEPNKVKLGEFLEAAIRGLINARLYVLIQLAAEAEFHNKASVSVSISQLLLLNNSIRGSSRMLRSRLKNKILITPTEDALDEVVLSNSYANMNRFLSDANKAPFKKGDILELKPAPEKECFDYGFIFSSGIDGKPFAVFIDAKSGRQNRSEVTDTQIVSETSLSISEDDVNMNSFQGDFDLTDLPKKGKQALHLLNISNMSKKWAPATVKKGSMLEALRSDNYLYIYINTTKSASSFAVGDHIMQLGEIDSKRFLSFFLDSYRLVRTGSTSAQDLDKKIKIDSDTKENEMNNNSGYSTTTMLYY